MTIRDQYENDSNDGPSENVDFIGSIDSSQLAETICAFANTSGGKIYVGVELSVNSPPFIVGVEEKELVQYMQQLDTLFDGPVPEIDFGFFFSDGVRVGVIVTKTKRSVNHALTDLNIWRRRSDKNFISRKRSAPLGSDPTSVATNVNQVFFKLPENEKKSNQSESDSINDENVEGESPSEEKSSGITVKAKPIVVGVELGDAKEIKGKPVENKNNNSSEEPHIPESASIELEDDSVAPVTPVSAGMSFGAGDVTKREDPVATEATSEPKESGSGFASGMDSGFGKDVASSTDDNVEESVDSENEDKESSTEEETTSENTVKLKPRVIENYTGDAFSAREKTVDDEESTNPGQLEDVTSDYVVDDLTNEPPKGGAESIAPVAQSVGGSSRVKPPIADSLKISRNSVNSEKCLNVDEYAEALSLIFKSADEDFCFGLFGHWGRGKTFLVEKLSGKLENEEYITVKLSAWKYRTTPELWAFLYETIAEKIKEKLGAKKSLCAIRSGLVKNGINSFLLTYFFIALWVSNVFADIRVLSVLVEFLGITATIKLIFNLIRLLPLVIRLKRNFLTLPSYSSTLGLQGLIGDDLKALLIGALPKNYWTEDSSQDVSLKQWKSVVALLKSKKKYLLRIRSIVYFVVSLVILASITSKLWTYAALSILVVVPIFIVLSILAPVVVFTNDIIESKNERLLLIVDDLDRCPSDQMLEIIESLVLLLDDDEIKKRVQICMLVEERSVISAILRKYEYLWCNHKNVCIQEGKTSVDIDNLKKEIIKENIEKIFLSYLRLDELSRSDLERVIDKFISYDEKEQAQSVKDEVLNEKVDIADELSVEIIEERDSNLTDSNLDEEIEGSKSRELHLTLEERIIINNCIKGFDSVKDSNRWGPRSARIMLIKYQLARTLLQELGSHPDPELLIKGLLYFTTENQPDGLSELEKSIIQQVV